MPVVTIFGSSVEQDNRWVLLFSSNSRIRRYDVMHGDAIHSSATMLGWARLVIKCLDSFHLELFLCINWQMKMIIEKNILSQKVGSAISLNDLYIAFISERPLWRVGYMCHWLNVYQASRLDFGSKRKEAGVCQSTNPGRL